MEKYINNYISTAQLEPKYYQIICNNKKHYQYRNILKIHDSLIFLPSLR